MYNIFGYVSLSPIMYNTLHSITPVVGVYQLVDRQGPGGEVRSTVDAFQLLTLVLLEDLFSSLSGIWHLLKSC